MIAKAFLALTFVGLTLSGVGCSSDDDDEDVQSASDDPASSRANTIEPAPSTSPTSEPTAGSTLDINIEQMCSLTVQPGYLPWLDPGETVLESGPVTVEGQSSLQWYEGPNPLSGAASTLLVDVEPMAAAGELIDVFLEGIETSFGTRASSGGVLIWEVNQEGCGGVALTLENVPNLAEAEVREELIRIAKGLLPR